MANDGWSQIRRKHKNIQRWIQLIKIAKQRKDYVKLLKYIRLLDQEAINLTRQLKELIKASDQKIKDALNEMEYYIVQSNKDSNELCLKIQTLLSENPQLLRFYQEYLREKCGF